MNVEILKIVGQVAGIGGLAIGAFIILLREVIRRNFFPQLRPREAYRLLRLIVILVWSVAIVGIIAWVYASSSTAKPEPNGVYPSPTPSESITPTPTALPSPSVSPTFSPTPANIGTIKGCQVHDEPFKEISGYVGNWLEGITVKARSADNKIYKARSNRLGYFEFQVPAAETGTQYELEIQNGTLPIKKTVTVFPGKFTDVPLSFCVSTKVPLSPKPPMINPETLPPIPTFNSNNPKL